MTLLELFKLLRKNLVLVIALPIVLALATAVISWGFLQNQYTATVSVYVLSEKNKENGPGSTTYTDLTAGQLIANDIAALAKSETVRERTAQALNMSSLRGYDISVASSTSSRVINISVTTGKADSAAIVANKIVEVLSKVAKKVMDVESVNVIDQAKVPESPSGPPRVMYTAVVFLAGIFLAVAIAVLLDMVNTRVRTPEEAEKLLGVPVIGRIPALKK